MKKILLMVACLISGFTTAFAQEDIIETFQFVKADGTVVENGSTIYVNKLETPAFDPAFISSGLFVKNMTEEAGNLSIEINVEELSNGNVQLCFPVNCSQYQLGKRETNIGAKNGGEVSDLQTEWVPSTYGKAKATYKIINYDYLGQSEDPIPQPVYQVAGDGPTVTVVYVYDDPAGINNATTNTTNTTSYYDLTGRYVAKPTKGLYVKKTTKSNGTVESSKVIIK